MASDGDTPNPASPPPAPVGKREPVETTVWGQTLVDPYRWLHNKESDEVRAHLEAENAHTEAVLAPVADLQSTLFDEIKARIKETDMSVPIVKDGWSYYSRTNEGDQYGIHCRRWVGNGEAEAGDTVDAAPEQVLLDENLEAGDSEFFDLGLFDVSPDHRLLLWGADRTGDEHFNAIVRDLETGAETDDGLDGLSYGSVWALDNKTFFYVRQDDTNRPFEVWRHEMGTPIADDVLIYRETDERFFVGIGRDKDDSFIYIGSSSKMTDELRVIPADQPTAEPRVILERRQGIEYSVSHFGDRFVILTNDGTENFRVVTAPDDAPGPDNWEELIAGSDDVTIGDIDVSAHFLTLFERTGGTTRIRLRSWADGTFTTTDQPESVSTTWPGANPDFDAVTLRYGYTSMVTPPSVFLLDTETGERELLKQQEVLGDFDPANYDTTRLWATSADGEQVPVSIVWRRDRADGPGPCVLYERQIRKEAEHVLRRDRCGSAPDRRGVDIPGRSCAARWLRWRVDGRRRGQPGAGVVRRRCGPRPICRCAQHHSRPDPTADGHRMGGVG